MLENQVAPALLFKSISCVGDEGDMPEEAPVHDDGNPQRADSPPSFDRGLNCLGRSANSYFLGLLAARR